MIHKNKAEKWGINYHSPIEKIKEEAYREGFIAGKNYIKDNVKLTLSNDIFAASFQTLRQYRETVIKWLEKL
jgi:hypothetical protein